jgi:hypothetical protein
VIVVGKITSRVTGSGTIVSVTVARTVFVCVFFCTDTMVCNETSVCNETTVLVRVSVSVSVLDTVVEFITVDAETLVLSCKKIAVCVRISVEVSIEITFRVSAGAFAEITRDVWAEVTDGRVGIICMVNTSVAFLAGLRPSTMLLVKPENHKLE